jgi:hypothetical protein
MRRGVAALTVGIEVVVSDRLGQDVHAFKGVQHQQSCWCVVHDMPSDLRQAGLGGRGCH